MALSFSAVMGYTVGFIQGYSHILWIILKSELLISLPCTLHSCGMHNRILIASVRNLGTCPCPRCLIPLARVHNLGMVRDMNQRITMARVDNNQHRRIVLSTRRFIYELTYFVNSAAVQRGPLAPRRIMGSKCGTWNCFQS